MAAPATAPEKAPRETLFLPDFCAPGAVLTVILIAELVALVLTLARAGAGDAAPVWAELARNSMFLLWVGLCSAAVLCYSRPWRTRLGVAGAAAVALALLLAVTAIVSEIAWWLDRYWAMRLTPAAVDTSGGHAAFMLRNLLICLIVSAATLRYFYVSHQWRREVEAAAAARVNALQARIRPHFLFNSMNTIAALTRTDPAAAEEAVEDLADLFRASLVEADRVTLAEELEIARLYQRIETLRLGERLTVQWDVETLPSRAELPGLSLQPLLENAIYHGIEALPAGGIVRVAGRRCPDETLEITVTNPLAAAVHPAARPAGHGMALGNIRERFRLAWGDRASVECGATDGEFRVRLRFPLRERAA